MTLQHTVQVISLALFLGLLVNAGFGFADWLPHDLFLRLDPAAALVTGVAARLWQGAFYGPPAFQTESGQMNLFPQSGRPRVTPRREADQSVRLSGFQPHCPAPSIGDAHGKSVSACLSSSIFQGDAFV